jgi:hypothetical protein
MEISVEWGENAATLNEGQRLMIMSHFSTFQLKVLDIFCSALKAAEKNYGWEKSFDRSKCL